MTDARPDFTDPARNGKKFQPPGFREFPGLAADLYKALVSPGVV
jgi:hypothetical protein